MPAATQNDVRMESAEKIAASGVRDYIEVANMPTTNDALNFLRAQKHMVVARPRLSTLAASASPVLEMSQNSERLSWTAEEVDAQLHKMMKNIHKRLRRGCRRVRPGLRPRRWRQHRRLQEGRRSHVRAGRVPLISYIPRQGAAKAAPCFLYIKLAGEDEKPLRRIMQNFAAKGAA